MTRKASKINKLVSNNGKKSHPCQTRLNKIFGNRVHFLERYVACKKGAKMYYTKDQAQPGGSNHEHERVPNHA